MNRSDLLAAAGNSEGISTVFGNVEEAAETGDTTEIWSFFVDATSPGTTVEVNAPSVGPHHGEVLALLFRCQCLDRFLAFLWGQPAAGSAVLQAGPVQGMATHDDNPLLVMFCPGCDKPSQRPARFELFLAEGS